MQLFIIMQEEITPPPEIIAKSVLAYMKSSNTSQKSLATELEVSQTLISRILNCKYTRVTTPIKKVYSYSIIHIEKKEIPNELISVISKYLASGGDPEVLENIVNALIGTNVRHKSLFQYER